MGLTVERRPVPVEEIAAFDEAAECGTAAVIAPISQIDDLDVNKSYVIAKDGKPGPVCEKSLKFRNKRKQNSTQSEKVNGNQ